jgi:hypothetical protein
MGLTDKIKNTIQDVTSIGAEKIDETNFNMKINDKKSDITKVEKDIGELVYAAYSRDERSFGDDVIKLCEKIKEIEGEIENLEKQKKEKIEKAKAERMNRRDDD